MGPYAWRHLARTGALVSAIINRSGAVRQLDKQGEPPERVTPEQWADAPRMTRLMTDVLRQLVVLQRRFWPLRLDYEDVAVDDTGTTVYRFPHGFGGRVRWWVVDWQANGSLFDHSLSKHSSSNDDTLALVSFTPGTMTLRIEEAG